MPAKDLEVGSRLPFVISLELFLALETAIFDHWFHYGRFVQLVGEDVSCFR